MPRDTVNSLLAASVACLFAAPAALASPGGGNSSAVITASFADSCRDLAAHSSKDISHVEIRYVDGRVVKDESISSPDYAVDGGAGGEITFAVVKSGTTSQQFDCVQSNRAPVARLEIQTPPDCHDFFLGGLGCEQSTPRTVWTARSDIPDEGGEQSGILNWACGGLTLPSLCGRTMVFRGIGSTDPDGDITSWSLDFGDGTSASGSWSTAAPTAVAHQYPAVLDGGLCIGVANGIPNVCVVVLTVSDSAGQSASEAIPMVFVAHTPD